MEKNGGFFRNYFGAQEKGLNYFYLDIFTVSTDITIDTVQLITIFEIDTEDICTILKLAHFPEELVIEEELSFEWKMKCPYFGDSYATKYKNDIKLGVEMTIKWKHVN